MSKQRLFPTLFVLGIGLASSPWPNAPGAWAQGPDAMEALPPARAVIPTPGAVGRPGPPAPRGEGESEVVRERHPDGRLAVERHVTLDDDENYVNHGAWISYDEAGAKQMAGQYVMGEAHGMWTRWYQGHETPLLQEPPYAEFQPPFVSQAQFRDGKLDGAWVVTDAQQRRISEITFSKGRRNGPATWWYPNGGKMRQLTFVDDLLEGEAVFYRPNGQPLRAETYRRGHRHEQLVQKHPDGRVHSKGEYRHPQVIMVTQDDWWEGTLAKFELQGEGTKEGEWTVYYPNGQKMMAGAYEHDQPVGEFTWWHETGQRALAGAFRAGAKHGEWTWWHPNGIKQSKGEFRHDMPHGMWASWDAEGTLVRRTDAVHGDESLAAAPGELPSPGQSGTGGVEFEELPPAVEGGLPGRQQQPGEMVRQDTRPVYNVLPELLHSRN